MAIGITLNLSNSSFPPLPPTPPPGFKRTRHSTSSNTLFTLSLPLQHFFPPPLLPTHSFLLSKDTPRAHPHHVPQPPKRCLNQPPTAIPAMLSTLLSPLQLVPGFRPLLSGNNIYYISVSLIFCRSSFDERTVSRRNHTQRISG